MAGEKQKAASYGFLLIVPEVSLGLEILRPELFKHLSSGRGDNASHIEATQLNLKKKKPFDPGVNQ